MIKTVQTCDHEACGKPIDPKTSLVKFSPLRGGLTLSVETEKGSAGLQLTKELAFCDHNCVAGYVKGLFTQIKPTRTDAPAPAAAPKS